MDIIKEIRKKLKQSIDSKALITTPKFFKEKIKFYGVRASIVKTISKEYFKEIKNKKKEEIYNLCEELWKSEYLEETFIASNWSYYLHKKYEPNDFNIFKNWINNYINNWASCDTFCNHTVGTFIEMYPSYITKLKEFTQSENRWVRRASAVSLIIPAKRGKFLKEILEICTLLLSDKDDMVQKGYGWLLKSASQSNLEQVFNYVLESKKIMPRVALRYAIEKMPLELKAQIMQK